MEHDCRLPDKVQVPAIYGHLPCPLKPIMDAALVQQQKVIANQTSLEVSLQTDRSSPELCPKHHLE